jgi:hypothetical protein
MDKLRYFAFCASVVLGASVPAQAEVELSYDKNTFINYWSCLGIYPGTFLALEEKVWIFSKDISPMIGKVVHVIPAADAQRDSMLSVSIRSIRTSPCGRKLDALIRFVATCQNRWLGWPPSRKILPA